MMAGWDIKKIKRWVFVGFSLWALLALVAWHYESTCGMFLSGDCWAQYWDGARHVVLLRWVGENETLVSASMALLGGFSVIAAAWLTIYDARQKDRENRRIMSRKICHIIAAEFQLAASALNPVQNQINKHDVRGVNFFEFTDKNKHDAYLISPPLGHIISVTKLQADKALQAFPHPDVYVASQCYAVWHLLYQLGNNLREDGSFDLEANGEIPVGILLATISKLGVQRNEIGAIADYFDWKQFE